MQSPFPGMDPYLERHWRDVHHSLIQYSRDALQPCLPDDLTARIEERVFVEAQRIRTFMPDLHISQSYPEPDDHPSSMFKEDDAVAEPLVFEWEELELTEGYIEIREGDDGKVITVIEFLSPTNKRAGAGQEKYLEKQAELLRSDVSLVEIDLVRTGQRVLALPDHDIPTEHSRDYLACISPGWKRSRRELYTMPLRRPLPVLPIPLRPREAPVKVDLQALVDHAYAAGRYHKLDYSLPLEPPLDAEDAAWAATLLRNQRVK